MIRKERYVSFLFADTVFLKRYILFAHTNCFRPVFIGEDEAAGGVGRGEGGEGWKVLDFNLSHIIGKVVQSFELKRCIGSPELIACGWIPTDVPTLVITFTEDDLRVEVSR